MFAGKCGAVLEFAESMPYFSSGKTGGAVGCAIVGDAATVGANFVGGIGEAVDVFVGNGVSVGVKVRVRVGVKVAVRVGVGVIVAVGGIATANLVGGGGSVATVVIRLAGKVGVRAGAPLLRIGVELAVSRSVGGMARADSLVSVSVGEIATANFVGVGTSAGRACVVDWQPVTHNTSKNNLICKSRTKYIRLIFLASWRLCKKTKLLSIRCVPIRPQKDLTRHPACECEYTNAETASMCRESICLPVAANDHSSAPAE